MTRALMARFAESVSAAELNILPIFMQQVRLQGLLVGPRDAFEAMNRAIAGARRSPS